MKICVKYFDNFSPCNSCDSNSLQKRFLFQSGDTSELAPRLPCKGKRGETPWCLPDKALPSDTPQLAAGRLQLPCKKSKKIKWLYEQTILVLSKINLWRQ